MHLGDDMRREFIIDGSKFNDLEGFYCEIDKLLTKDLTWKTGHNLDAFNDLLRGGFGVHEYGEPILLRWINFEKSKQCLGYEAKVQHYEMDAEKHSGATVLDLIIEIILDTNNSGHDCKLEIEI